MERDIHDELTGIDLWLNAMGEGQAARSPLGEVIREMLRSEMDLPWREAFRYATDLCHYGISLAGVRVMPGLNGTCGWFIHPEEPTAVALREEHGLQWELRSSKGPWQRVFFARRSGGWRYRHPVLNARAEALVCLASGQSLDDTCVMRLAGLNALKEGGLEKYGTATGGGQGAVRLEPNKWATKVVARYKRIGACREGKKRQAQEAVEAASRPDAAKGEFVITFQYGRDGSAMAKVNGRVAFPSKKGPEARAYERWIVAIEGENPRGTVYFLRLVRKID